MITVERHTNIMATMNGCSHFTAIKLTMSGCQLISVQTFNLLEIVRLKQFCFKEADCLTYSYDGKNVWLPT